MSWNLRDSAAKWRGPHWSVGTRLAHRREEPWLQVQDSTEITILSLGMTPRELHGLRPSAELPLGEAYVRQNDLIAIYHELAPWRFGYQADVRVLTSYPGNGLTLEIWLSIQTSLLDSHPQLELSLTGNRFQKTVENCWTNESSQIGLLLHPLDQSDCEVAQQEDRLEMRAFGRFMEKGVIRRMRFRLIAASEPEPHAYWKDRFEEFSESPLPLTT